MRLLLSTVILAVVCLGQEPEAAIRDLVRKYVDAREKIDPKATQELFTPDADQLVSSGEWRKGRDAVVTGSMASSKQNAAKRTITVENVRFLGDDVAIADGRYVLAGAEQTRQMWATIVCRRGPDRVWRIAAIRNMLPAK